MVESKSFLKARLNDSANLAFFALVLWREARGESLECRRAIAMVIMARAKNTMWWGNGLMEVLFKPLQFSSVTDPHDAQLCTWPGYDDRQFLECLNIAYESTWGFYDNPVPGADHYYDISIKPPKWADESKLVKQIGRVRFYNLHPEKKVEP